jgi:putative nucleotidyltransferase with HDIG domain
VSALRGPLRAYVMAVIAVGCTALVLTAALDVRASDSKTLLTFAFLTLLVAVAKTRPIHVSLKLKMTVDDAPMFASALLLGPFLATTGAFAATFVGLRFGTKMPLYNRLFNSACSGLSACTAAVTYAALAVPGSSLVANPGPIVAGAVAGYLTQTVLVDIAVGLQLRRDIARSFWRVHRADIGPEAILYGAGAATAVLAPGFPWAAPIVLIPMWVAFVALRGWTGLRERTRAALVRMADLIDERDRYTYGHSQRVAELARKLALRMRLAPSQVELITEAARVHDIGKITTPDRVLQKPGALDPEEWEVMHQHSEAGYGLLQDLSEFWEGAELVRSHHERPDGRGYPGRAKGFELPLEASIISVCDAYDAMTSDRVYRRALSWSQVRAELINGRGSQWHAVAVDALVQLLEEERAGAHLEAAAASA